MNSVIDVDADRAFQERYWVFVRVGWVAMAGLWLAAVLGFTGGGGIYSSQTVEAGASRIELPAVARWQASDQLTVHVAEPGNRTTVLVPAGFGDVFTIESVTPQPVSVTAVPSGDLYEFARQPGGPITIDFTVRPARPVWRARLDPFEINDIPSAQSMLTVLP